MIRDRRTRAEAVRRSGEASYRLIVDTIPALIATMTAEGEVEHVNRQLYQYFGTTFEELKHGATSDAVHPDHLPQVIDAWRHALSAMDFRTKSNTACAAQTVCTAGFMSAACRFATKKGVSLRWYVLMTDIDERKASEARLQSSLQEIERLKDRLQDENLALREEVDQAFMFEEIVGSSKALNTALCHVSKVAPTD